MRKLIAAIFLLSLMACQTVKDKNEQSDSQSVITNEIHRKQSQAPIMGWSSWNNYRVQINENLIRSQADAMVSKGLKEVGYSYINIDDGYFGGRDENGSLLAHPQKFPSGMKSLAAYIHSKGLKAGIYSDAGINTCASMWDNDTIGSGVGLLGHDQQDMELMLNHWNYDFIKVDWCGGRALNLDEQTRYTEIGSMIKMLNSNVGFNVCRWQFPGKWVTQVADSWRISGDIDNTFASILTIIDLNADLWPYSSLGHYNDMDMLQVGRGMTYEEDKTHFSMWCMMHSPLLLGNDLTTITDETIGIITNKDLIALNQNTFVYQARRLVDQGELEVWAKPLVSTMSGKIVVALLNRSDQTEEIAFQLETIGLKAAAAYTAKDLWTKENFASTTHQTIKRRVPAHGFVVLEIKGKALPYNVFQYKSEL